MYKTRSAHLRLEKIGAANHGKVVEVPRPCRSCYPMVVLMFGRCFNYQQSSQVFVHIRIVLVTLQVIPCDEILNPLFDGFEVRLKHIRKTAQKM
jgi:hypothetical protein